MACWDTSCLLKLYAPESDSAVFQAHAARGGAILTSELTRLDLFTALASKEAAIDLHPGAAKLAMAAFDGDRAASLIGTRAIGPAVVQPFEQLVAQCHQRATPVPLRTR